MGSIVNYEKAYKLNRPITGVIHEDRIWEQWYNPEKMKKSLPKMNQRDYLFECNKGYEEQTIINNRGMKNITVSNFLEMVNKFTKALVVDGIKEKDIIVTIALSTPELLALKYACATIGAVTANLNFNDAKGNIDGNKMYKQLKILNPKMIFTLDILENQVSEVINDNEFKNIKKVILPLSMSTPILNSERFKIAILRKINSIKKLDIRQSVSLNEFLKLSLKHNGIIQSVYKENMPSNISFTSATTGESKAVLLSHDANNALAMQHEIAELGLERGKTNLALVPPFLAFWDADIIHMAMCLGVENILELSLTYEEIPKYITKYLPNYGIWSQYLWDSVLTMSKEDIKKFASCVDKIVVGGERAEINQTNRFAEITGVIQDAGYGATEMDSCFSVAHPNCNVLGSAGIPLPFNNVKVVDENFKDLTYNQPGRMLITGPGQMLGYYGRDDLTKEVLIPDENGTLWYDTKDYGYVDITGSIVPLDRDNNKVVIEDKGSKEEIKLIDVSEKIKECPYIKLCKTNSYENILVSHIVLDNFSGKDENEMKKSMIEVMNEKLLEFERPHYINLMPSLPRTPLGKVDYKKLGEMTEDIVLENVGKVSNNSRLNIMNSTMDSKIYKKHI